jgi:hypothetical protein
MGKDLGDKTPKAQKTKAKQTRDYIKLKSSCTESTRRKRQATEWEKMLANCTSDRR